MNEDIKITKEDLVLWLDRPPSNDDLDLCSYLSKAVENQYKYYQRINKAIEYIDNTIVDKEDNTGEDLEIDYLLGILKGEDTTNK